MKCWYICIRRLLDNLQCCSSFIHPVCLVLLFVCLSETVSLNWSSSSMLTSLPISGIASIQLCLFFLSGFLGSTQGCHDSKARTFWLHPSYYYDNITPKAREFTMSKDWSLVVSSGVLKDQDQGSTPSISCTWYLWSCLWLWHCLAENREEEDRRPELTFA